MEKLGRNSEIKWKVEISLVLKLQLPLHLLSNQLIRLFGWCFVFLHLNIWIFLNLLEEMKESPLQSYHVKNCESYLLNVKISPSNLLKTFLLFSVNQTQPPQKWN